MKFERDTTPSEPFTPYLAPLTSEERFKGFGRDTTFHIKMPISCKRSMGGPEGVLAALGGNPVTIDGTKYEVTGVEMFRPAFPIRIGESINLLVKPWSEP